MEAAWQLNDNYNVAERAHLGARIPNAGQVHSFHRSDSCASYPRTESFLCGLFDNSIDDNENLLLDVFLGLCLSKRR
jgi:hypothetical protein